MKYLGETFDIHAGGDDLIFPHHENEIAQSEARRESPSRASGSTPSILLVEGEKMSKSLGQLLHLARPAWRGYKPSAIRFLLPQVPYRKQLNFTFDGLRAAASNVEWLRELQTASGERGLPGEGRSETITTRGTETAAPQMEWFAKSMDDDLNTAGALAAVFEIR